MNVEYSPANKALLQKRIRKYTKKINAYKFVEKQARLEREFWEGEVLADMNLLAEYRRQQRSKKQPEKKVEQKEQKRVEEKVEEKKEEDAPAGTQYERQKLVATRGGDLKFSDFAAYSGWDSYELESIYNKVVATNTSTERPEKRTTDTLMKHLRAITCTKCDRLSHCSAQHNMWQVEQYRGKMTYPQFLALDNLTDEDLSKILRLYHLDGQDILDYDSLRGKDADNRKKIIGLLASRSCQYCDMLSHHHIPCSVKPPASNNVTVAEPEAKPVLPHITKDMLGSNLLRTAHMFSFTFSRDELLNIHIRRGIAIPPQHGDSNSGWHSDEEYIVLMKKNLISSACSRCNSVLHDAFTCKTYIQ